MLDKKFSCMAWPIVDPKLDLSWCPQCQTLNLFIYFFTYNRLFWTYPSGILSHSSLAFMLSFVKITLKVILPIAQQKCFECTFAEAMGLYLGRERWPKRERQSLASYPRQSQLTRDIRNIPWGFKTSVANSHHAQFINDQLKVST